MDLKEAQFENTQRHPWELARIKALQTILKAHQDRLPPMIHALDIGSGDGFTAPSLLNEFHYASLYGVDDAIESDTTIEGMPITRWENLPQDPKFNLTLCLDVIEHIDDPYRVLSQSFKTYLDPKAVILITVPAWQLLFSEHDRFLGHFRRYSPKTLKELTEALGLKEIASGCLFSSLLLPRFITRLKEKLFNTDREQKGLAAWNAGQGLSWLTESVLNIDNHLLIKLARHNIRLPGLSLWYLGKRIND